MAEIPKKPTMDENKHISDLFMKSIKKELIEKVENEIILALKPDIRELAVSAVETAFPKIDVFIP